MQHARTKGWARCSSPPFDDIVADPEHPGVLVVETGWPRGKGVVVQGTNILNGQVALRELGLMTMRAGTDFELMRTSDGRLLGLNHRNYGQAVLDRFYALPLGEQSRVRQLFCPSVPSRYLKTQFGDYGERVGEQLQIPPEGSVEEAWMVLRIFNCNAQTQYHPETGDIETLALYPLQARINHSCSPNVLNTVGKNGYLEVLALQQLAAGDELCQSYLNDQDLSWSGADRRAKLLRVWGFLCECPR